MKYLLSFLLCFLMLQTSVQSQSAEEIISIGIKLGETDLDSSLNLLEQGVLAAEVENDTLLIARGRFFMGRYQLRTNDFAMALDNYQKSHAGFILLNDEYRANTCMSSMGTAYNMLKMHDDALRCYLSTLPYFENKPDSVSQFTATGNLANIGTVYALMDEDSLALVYYQKALTKGRELNNTYLIAQTVTIMGVLMLKIDKDAAMPYLEEARKLSTELGDFKNVATVEIHLGDYYGDEEEYGRAIPYFEKGLQIAEDGGVEIVVAEVLNKLGNAQHEMGRDRIALDLLQRGLVISKRENLIVTLKGAYDVLQKVYHSLGRSEEAYEALKMYNSYKDSIDKRTEMREIGRIEGEYQVLLSQQEIESQAQTIEHLRIKERNNAIIQALWIFAAVLILFLIAGMVKFNSVRRKKDQKILEKEQQLAESLKKSLEYRKQETTDLVSMITFKNEIIKKAEKEFKKALGKSDLKEVKAKVKSISLDLQLSENSLEVERLFSISEVTQREFHERLRKEFKLTQRDLKLCTLIRLDLSIKEISATIGSSEKAVEMAKYRLKKKVQLEVQEDLNLFIRNY